MTTIFIETITFHLSFLFLYLPANQQTVHLKCYGIAPEKGRGYWWGLEFYNSTLRTSVEGSIRINESASRFKHVDILYAGVAPNGDPVPAVRAQPLAPHLFDVTIRYSALDATNFTNIKSSTLVHKSEISHNRGDWTEVPCWIDVFLIIIVFNKPVTITCVYNLRIRT